MIKTKPVRATEVNKRESVMQLEYEGFTVWVDCEKRGAVKFQYNAQRDTRNHKRSSDFFLDPNVSKECQQ